MVRKLDPESWRVESTDFDGETRDNFTHTSLHLSFTDWQAPLVQFQSVGQRDADVNIIEAVVSVRDAGKWVADVDIYQALLSRRLRRETNSKRCEHVLEGLGEGQGYAVRGDELLSIETWDQVLDYPDGSAVVRCFGNWVGKLAIVSVLCQHIMADDRPVIICSKKVCWQCEIQNREECGDVTYIY